MFTTVKVLTVTESTFGLTGWSIVLSLSQIPSWVKPKTLAMEYDNFLPDIKKKTGVYCFAENRQNSQKLECNMKSTKNWEDKYNEWKTLKKI